MQIIEVITPERATELLRSMGMRISPDTIRRGIQQRVFPFGVFIETGNGHPVYQIYKRLFDQWVAERATEKVAM